MPEGDTIYRAARALQRAIVGRVVTGFETGLAKLARVNDDAPLVGRTVEKVEAKGKWCLIYFSALPGTSVHSISEAASGEKKQVLRLRYAPLRMTNLGTVEKVSSLAA